MNTVVNVLSIASDEDNVALGIVGQLANKTSGWVERVRPETIGEELGNILKNDAIAVDVSVTILASKHFAFRDIVEGDADATKTKKKEEKDGDGVKGKGKEKGKGKSEGSEQAQTLASNKMHKYLGVVGASSEVPFQFDGCVVDSDALPSQMPFQVQIHYTRMDGTKVVQLATIYLFQ